MSGKKIERSQGVTSSPIAAARSTARRRKLETAKLLPDLGDTDDILNGPVNSAVAGSAIPSINVVVNGASRQSPDSISRAVSLEERMRAVERMYEPAREPGMGMGSLGASLVVGGMQQMMRGADGPSIARQSYGRSMRDTSSIPEIVEAYNRGCDRSLELYRVSFARPRPRYIVTTVDDMRASEGTPDECLRSALDAAIAMPVTDCDSIQCIEIPRQMEVDRDVRTMSYHIAVSSERRGLVVAGSGRTPDLLAAGIRKASLGSPEYPSETHDSIRHMLSLRHAPATIRDITTLAVGNRARILAQLHNTTGTASQRMHGLYVLMQPDGRGVDTTYAYDSEQGRLEMLGRVVNRVMLGGNDGR